MTFVLLIHQGTTPLPGTPEWSTLSEEEQRAPCTPTTRPSNGMDGVTPGLPPVATYW